MTGGRIETVRIRRRLAIATLSLLLFGSAAPAEAEMLRKRWSFGGNLSYFYTKDNVRSNANTVIGPAGDDGIPFTGDPNEDLNCRNTFQVYCDPRPDDQASRYIRIRDAAQYNVNVGYGVTDNLSLRLDASYSQSEVGPISYYFSDHYPRGTEFTPNTLVAFKDRAFTQIVSAGRITEVPVTLSAIVRFRIKRPVNPYLVAGAGKLFTNVDADREDLQDMHRRLRGQRIRAATDEGRKNIVPIGIRDLTEYEARIPYIWNLEPQSSNAFHWHLGAGIEYFFTDRLSLSFEGRYMTTDESLILDVGRGEDQVNLVVWSEKLYRSDGTLRVFGAGRTLPDGTRVVPAHNPFCYENGRRGLGCDPQAATDFSTRVDPEGEDVFGRQRYTCPAQGDFDGDGRVDICYSSNIAPSPTGVTEPRGDIIVQGGRINLSGLSGGVSLRVHF